MADTSICCESTCRLFCTLHSDLFIYLFIQKKKKRANNIAYRHPVAYQEKLPSD